MTSPTPPACVRFWIVLVTGGTGLLGGDGGCCQLRVGKSSYNDVPHQTGVREAVRENTARVRYALGLRRIAQHRKGKYSCVTTWRRNIMVLYFSTGESRVRCKCAIESWFIAGAGRHPDARRFSLFLSPACSLECSFCG